MKVRQIEIGLTHEIKIHGDKTWVKVGMTADLDSDEDTERALDRLSQQVQQAVMDEVTTTVATVEEYTK